MEDIEFLQHFGGMNPGERFYKMAPHLKPSPSKEDLTKYYYNMFIECCAGRFEISGVPDNIADNMKHDLLLKGRYEGPIR